MDSEIGIGDTYNHLVEKGGRIVTDSGSVWDGPLDMINYPDVTHGNQFSLGPIVINNEGDFLVSISTSAHFGFGGHASASLNITELIERLDF